jgi:hypothetical protein
MKNMVARNILLWAAIPAMVCVAYWPVRLAWADSLCRASDVQTVVRGVRLSPGDADLRLKLAAVQHAAGADPSAALKAAAALDPGNANTWIRLGLQAEIRGDPRTAESLLLQAARVSRQFAPRWALANYYFRHGDSANFWPWARASLSIGYADLNPVFRLCWNMSQDGGLILERAIPQRRAVLNAYLQFLTGEGRLAASEPAAARLAVLATAEDQPALVIWCNRQLDAGSVSDALGVWNTLCARHLLPYAPIDRARAPLTDGGFAAGFDGGGFAWMMPSTPGVTMGRNPSPRYLWAAFGGDQPETCAPLWQFVPLAPGAGYRLRYEYRTSQIPPASGMRWSAFDARTGKDLAVAAPWLSNPDWTSAELRFRGPESGLVRLTLTCTRLAGAMRIEGSVNLRNLSLGRL